MKRGQRDGVEGQEMASKRKRSDGGGDDPPADPDPPANDEPPVADAGGGMVDIWSCDTISVAVKFPVEHAWLLLRNFSTFLDMSKDEMLLRFKDGKGDSFSQEDLTFLPRSFCTEEVLKYIREYVRDYVHLDGAYKEAGPLTRWNFHGDAQRANGANTGLGAKCFKLLEAARYLELDIWSEAVTKRNDAGQTTPSFWTPP